jgi:DNA-directed RNA polymerase subunit RPC12/RpoP
MADSFHCPQCGKAYSRENRLVGKAVVCECGHRFLVPPAEQASQPPLSFPSLPRRPSPRGPRQTPAPGSSGVAPSSGKRPGQPPTRRPDQSPGRPPGQTRWADPIEPGHPADETMEAEPMLIADVVYPAQAIPQVEDDFDDDAEEVVLVPIGAKPAPPARRPPPRGPATARAARRHAGPTVSAGQSPARLAMLVGLPLIALLMVAAAAGVWYFGNRDAAVAEADDGQLADEPPASGQPVTLFNARSVKRGETKEFRVEFRLDGLKPDAKSQYRWVVAGSTGWIEFPVPVSALAPRSRLSGVAPADASKLQGPLRSYFEEQGAGALDHDRISNEVELSEAG